MNIPLFTFDFANGHSIRCMEKVIQQKNGDEFHDTKYKITYPSYNIFFYPRWCRISEPSTVGFFSFERHGIFLGGNERLAKIK